MTNMVYLEIQYFQEFLTIVISDHLKRPTYLQYRIELLTTYILRRLEAVTVLEQEDSFEVLLADHLATFSSKLLFPLCSEL